MEGERRGSQLVINLVGVEEVRFSQNSENLRDRKSLGKRRKSFLGHPSAKFFPAFSRVRVFQQPPLIATAIAAVGSQPTELTAGRETPDPYF